MGDTWSELYMVELLHLTGIPAKLGDHVKGCRKEDTSTPHPRRQRIRRNIIAVNRHPGLDIDEAFDKWKKPIEYPSVVLLPRNETRRRGIPFIRCGHFQIDPLLFLH